MYLEDLANATEIVPGSGTRRVQARNMRSRRLGSHRKRGGVRRLAAGALALSNSVGRTMSSRSLTATEASSIAIIGFARRWRWPCFSCWCRRCSWRPSSSASCWLGVALLIRSFRLKTARSACAGASSSSGARGTRRSQPGRTVARFPQRTERIRLPSCVGQCIHFPKGRCEFSAGPLTGDHHGDWYFLRLPFRPSTAPTR